MRLRKHVAALALACAAAGATGAAFAQSPAPTEAQEGAPRSVDVTVRPVEVAAQPAEPQAAADPARPAEAPVPVQSSFKFVQAQDPAAPADARNPQREYELYRAHFGGELTKAAYLGVSTSGVPAALSQHLGLPEGVGLVVDFVEDESPAKAAGLKQYDILKKFDDQILVNGQQLAVLVRSHKTGDEVKLTLVRGGKEQALTAKLVEKDVKPLNDIFWGVPGDVDARVSSLKGRLSRVPAAPRNPTMHTQKESGGRTMMVWRDNDMSLTITKNQDEEGRRLVVTDKSGKTIYQGNLDDKDDRAKLPPEIAEKVKQMESKQQPDKEPRGDGNNFRGKLNAGDGANAEIELDASFNFESSKEEKSDGDEEVDVEVDLKPSAKIKIGDNDLLNISIDGVHGHGVKTEKVARVRDGQVRLPYIAPVKCVGLTVGEMEKQIATVYAEAKVAPKVNVRVRKMNDSRWTRNSERQ